MMREQQARLNYRNAGLQLSNHLWDEVQRPLELGSMVVPVAADLDSPPTFALADTAIERAIEQHPELLRKRAGLDQLEVDARYRAELLKPQLDLQYQFLGGAGALSNETGTTALGEGHQLGVGFAMPLLLRRERGELSLSRLRLADAEFGFERDRTVIRNNVRQRLNEIATYRQQADLGSEMVTNYSRLLSGETQRFAAGESSLFLVNGREVPLIEASLKQIEFEARLRKAFFALDHDAGTLWRSWDLNTE